MSNHFSCQTHIFPVQKAYSRDDRTCPCDPTHPMRVLYLSELHPEFKYSTTNKNSLLTFVFYLGNMFFMVLFKVLCNRCQKDIFRSRGRINENKKLGRKFYCSLKCLGSHNNKQKLITCENPNCKKTFLRQLNDLSPHNYCGHSCAATITNAQRIRIKKPKIIKPPRFLHSKETVILRIKKFVNEHKRVPQKREMWGLYEVARKFFGTWNNAVEAAGFDSNPVMCANKQLANDGHICDSLAEKIIDDYLFEKGISHERNCPYPEGDYTADFKIKNKYIEYFGLAGELTKYDELMEIKKEIAIKHKMNLLEIYPKNLYRKNGLDEIFGK